MKKTKISKAIQTKTSPAFKKGNKGFKEAKVQDRPIKKGR